MKNYLLLFFAAIILSSFSTDDTKTSKDSIVFFEGDYSEALSLARKSKKPIFLDFYADWCGPCKQMDKYSFTDPEFAKIINEKFIPFRVNVDFFWGMDIADRYEIKKYPTIIFTDKKGREQRRAIGFKSGKELTRIAKGLTKKK